MIARSNGFGGYLYEGDVGYKASDSLTPTESHHMIEERIVADMDTERREELAKEQAQQGTETWIADRLGHVTASRFSEVMTKARSGSGMGKTAESYLIDLVGEHLTQKPSSVVKTQAMEWGSLWEPVARAAYAQRANIEVQEVGFVEHPLEPFVGCSPDGLIGEDGGCEIKCPMTFAPHVRVMMDGKCPDEHTAQIQGAMWITGRKWWDFISYHTHFPEDLRLLVIRVPRDEELITKIEQSVVPFRDELLNRVNEVIKFWERQVAA